MGSRQCFLLELQPGKVPNCIEASSRGAQKVTNQLKIIEKFCDENFASEKFAAALLQALSTNQSDCNCTDIITMVVQHQSLMTLQ